MTVVAPVVLALPFRGRWLVQNSPARRVPSHGVDVLGERYAIDFVGVDERGRTAPHRDWRTLLATEPPERFVAFGRPVLAPVEGTVVAVHDGEEDHAARRSQLALVPYVLGQAARLRRGPDAVAGNHLVLRDRASGAFVALVHLRRGSLRVAVGDDVVVGGQVAACGSSGNSTQPHLHVQAMDATDLTVARGLPIVFTGYREHVPGRRGSGRRGAREVASGVPGEGTVVEPLDRDAP
ncbi:peptidase M23-like protein [Cellulomonas sp. PhB143]|nr:peptidase M23-like protein [Cellulomonas sp. PhB143]